MNQLEQEKRLVAKFMGWEAGVNHINGVKYSSWNPQTDRNAWPEIFLKIENSPKDFGVMSIKESFTTDLFDLGMRGGWGYLTASPEVCWQALVATLEGE